MRSLRSSLVAVAVFVIAALALVPDLGGQYVWSKDEARDGLVARDMVETGNWLIPHVGGRVYPYKPPLFHWLVALVSRGGVTEWSLRLPSVLAAAGTVALTYAMGARLGSPTTGLVAAAVLASSATFVEWARTGRLEMLLVLWLTLGLWSGMRWLDEGQRGHVVLLGLALGLGCLTKGPIGLAPLGILIVARALLGRWSPRALVDLGLALALPVALPVAWLGLAAVAQAGVDDYLKAVIANFGDEIRALRDQHFLFAGEAIGMGFLPWTIVLPGASLVLVRRWRTSWRVLLVPLLCIALVLVVFTVVMSPRAVYFLPIYPALALVVAWAWASCSAAERRWMMYPLGLVVIAIVVAGLGLTIRPLAIESASRLTVLDRELGMMAPLIAGAAGFGAIVLLRHRRADVVPVVVGIAALLLLVLLLVTVDTRRINRAYPTREVAARFAALLSPGDEVAYVDLKLSTALMFYLPHRGVKLPRIRAIEDLPDRSWRHALIPHEEMMLLVRKQCGPPPPLREETLFGGRYVLVDLEGVGPQCIKARPRVADR
jgi:4-amino-4-deoxy-L-arabinose transferase-like glycosyltransferase